MQQLFESISKKPETGRPGKFILKKDCKLMGNHFVISVVTDDEADGNTQIETGINEIQRIERLLTTFSNNSETSLINSNAGVAPVTVSAETFELIQRSIKISALTQGAFDITYGSIDKSLWNFDQNMTALPPPEVARKMVRLIDYRKIILDAANHTVFLKDEGMRIGFGGIGKGYAAERAKYVMQKAGANAGVVNASGDLTTWGFRPDGSPWTVGVVDPNMKNRIFSYMDISNMAIATSGSYEKYVVIDGRKYSHTINPRTGLPASGIKSVTIITTNAEIADAIATPVTVMGVTAGLDMINQMKNIEAIIIDDNDFLYTSNNINVKTPD